MIDLLAGIPSVVYRRLGRPDDRPLRRRKSSRRCSASYSSGYSVLAAGAIVLAIMVFPTIIHVSLEVFASVPHELRDASLSLGATTWETVKHVVLRKGLGRDHRRRRPRLFAGPSARRWPSSWSWATSPGRPEIALRPGAYPLPALLANNYGEMMSIPLYDSALMLAALVLLLVVLVFNIGARIVLVRVERKAE